MLTNGQQVSIRYCLYAEDGQLAASNKEDDAPQTFFLGRGQMLPAIEEAIRSMKIGEQKTLTLPPEQAFGETKAEFLKTSLLHHIPEGDRKIGTIVELEDAENNHISARIHAIDGQQVVLDFNHPLAGQRISFDLQLEAIGETEKPTKKPN